MPNFRNIAENTGGTLPRKDSKTPLVGTWGCITCVGVYFNVDEERCFVAHMNGSSAVTYPSNFVTERGGQEIQEQVARRLCGFLQRDSWDIRDPAFGSGLFTICPESKNKRHKGSNILCQHAGKFVLQAIEQFFDACARTIEIELKRRQDQSDSASKKLQQRVAFLRNQAFKVVPGVHTRRHAFVIDPSSGTVKTFGDTKDRKKPTDKDLKAYKPISVDTKRDVCLFILADDDASAIPAVFHASEADTKQNRQWKQEIEGKFEAVERRLDNLALAEPIS